MKSATARESVIVTVWLSGASTPAELSQYPVCTPSTA